MKNHLVVFLIAFVISSGTTFAQIVTAEKYLEQVSNKYAGFNDYEAKIGIKSGGNDMFGTISHRSPSFLKIEFTTPAEQVIVFNGEMLTVYLPEYRAILNQSVQSSGTRGAGLAASGGLTIMRRSFAAAYITGPDPVSLDDGSPEKVVKLRLSPRSGGAGFREIILSIDPSTLLIRRIAATTLGGALLRFDFSNIKTNIGIPETRFIYDSPASANVYNNFLFRDTE
ncbi:MAG: outer-membrane lipoprotein carrier protein LolA [Termitinemataceae bacterium]|nr:MAG: outer-membrane lipoprotein carrier protein LolA [Termitinemataceae bacterium]